MTQGFHLTDATLRPHTKKSRSETVQPQTYQESEGGLIPTLSKRKRNYAKINPLCAGIVM